MLKRLLCAVLCLAVVLSMGPDVLAEETDLWAEEVFEAETDLREEAFEKGAASGNLGKNLCWTFEDGVLNISGRGQMMDFEEGGAPWYHLRDQIRCVFVEEYVTSVGNHAFDGLENVNLILLRQDVKRIGEGAFRNCGTLTELTLPEGVDAIGRDTFSGCEGLERITLPEALTAIGPNAFRGCAALRRLTIPESVRTLGTAAFAGCRSLTQAVIPEGVTNIESSLFSDCESLTEISIPETVSAIGFAAFQGCGSLTALVLPEGLTEIGERAFQNCGALEEIRLPDGITVLESGTFEGCAGLRHAMLPDELEEIKDGAFRGCGNLRQVTLPGAVETLGSAVFQNCGALERISLGENVTCLPESVFSGCESLKGIELPQGLESIAASAFENCGALEAVEFPEGLQKIGANAFLGCGSLAEISVPDSVKGIGANAFSGCGGLKKAVLPKCLERLEENLFRNCGALAEVKFPENMRQIGPGAFYGCGSLKIASVPETVVSVGKEVFFGCDTSGMIDLSKVPEALWEETVLDELVALPEFLTGLSGGQSRLAWSLKALPGQEKAAKLEVVQGRYVLKPLFGGRVCLVCEDTYTGIWSEKAAEIRVFWEILPREVPALVSGKQQRFRLAVLPSGEEQEAKWSVEPNGEQAASITENGLLTAKAVERAEKITITALPDGGEPIHKELTILPQASRLALLLNGVVLDGTLEVDLAQSGGLQLSALVTPEDALQGIQWSSDNEETAEIDEHGSVTLRSLGRAVLHARCTDGSGTEETLELLVFYRDKAPTLTLQSEARELDPGQTTQLTLMGEGPIEARCISYSVSGEASIDDSGLLTAGDIPGVVTVTAALRDDPLERRAEISLRIRQGAIHTLRLVPEFPDDRGYFLPQDGEPRANVEAPKLRKQGYVFSLEAQGSRGRDLWETLTEVSYESSDETLAAVREDGTVFVQANREGSCVLTARTTGENPLEAQICLTVADTSPRLETATLTVNSYLEEAVSTGLVESYGNTVTGVTLFDYHAKTRTYASEPSQNFQAAFSSEGLSIASAAVLKNGTYPVKLTVACGGRSYDYALQLKVANRLPKVDVRQSGKFNLFDLDTSVPLSVSGKDCRIGGVELVGADSFRLAAADDGEYELRYAEGIPSGTKVNPKGTLRVFLEGYRIPVEKAITVATENRAPKLTVTPGSTTVRKSREAVSRLQVSVSDQPLDLTQAELRCTSGNGEFTAEGETLWLQFTGTKSGTVQFTLRLPNWASEVKLSHRVTVEDRVPTVKPEKSTLSLNRLFPGKAASTAVGLTQQNETLREIIFVPSAKKGTAQYLEAEKLSVSYDPLTGMAAVRIENPENLPKDGTYGFSYHGILADGTVLSAGSLKVKVESNAPKVKLGLTSARMNAFLAGEERVRIPVTSLDPAYRVAGFREEYEELTYQDGILTVCLTERSRNTAFSLTPIVEAVDGSGQAELPSKLKLGLTVYRSEQLQASVSAKGKLDTLAPDSAMLYTVTKLSNCLGTIEDMALAGTDGGAFRAALDTSGAKPVVRLTLREDMDYQTKKTYRIRFQFSVCGKVAQSPELQVRVTQSGLKVAARKNPTYYLGQAGPVKWTMDPSAPVETVALNEKTDRTFRQALGEMTRSGNEIFFPIAHPEKLQAGKSYSVLLDLTPAHSAADIKPTQVRLTVKAMK